jgi:hypothetical protein
MKRICAIFLVAGVVPVFPLQYTQKDRDLLVEIRTKLHEIDKRFEQIDRRFEQIDKRFEDLKIYMGLMTTITIAVLSYVMYRIHKIEDKNEAKISERMLITMREVAQKDPKWEKALKVTGLI